MEHRTQATHGQMTDETLQAVVRGALSYAKGTCTFGFQGGEPTLAGLGFFRRVVELQKQYNVNNAAIHNAIQTNGTLLNDAWAAFFRENNFLVGLSIDGHESLHDLYRRDADGNGTHGRLMRAVKLLRTAGVDFNAVTVVTAQTAKNIRQAYAFFMRNGLLYQQYIPCLDPIGEQRGRHQYSLTPALYARFLKTLFDLWYRDRAAGKFVYIRYFENLAALLLGQPPESCGISGVCSPQFAIEADGTVYPCDFYMLDAYKLGNVHTSSFAQIEDNRRKSGFVQYSAKLPQPCMDCPVVYMCRGGCRRDRMNPGENDSGTNYFCEAFREFFPYAAPKIKALL
jgi:uncharacterized protein